MQGVFTKNGRPKYKKDLAAAVANEPETVTLEATSIFEDDYGGPVVDAPPGTYYVVGPDPHKTRKWWGQVIVGEDGAIRVK